MIRKTQHKVKAIKKDFENAFNDRTHIELYIITTYWLFFIPIYRSKELLDSNIK